MIARITSLGNLKLMDKDMTTIDTHEHIGSGMHNHNYYVFCCNVLLSFRDYVCI